jgi:DNA-binding XRE family transcriptional regulator
MNGAQLRMARAALKMTVRDLGLAADVSPDTVVKMEAGGAVKAKTTAKVQAALEAAGIAFIERNGGGLGVRMKDAD